ncbi:hypothetical protein L7F22_048273 [Adiantum nelumboides]|nr:hypothetical protein [Adiantum nelumboides]
MLHPFYDLHNLSKNDPFADLYTDIATYTPQGAVMILRDLNACRANIQVQLVDYSIHPADKDGDLVLDAMWDRCSCDHLMNEQGSALISMMNSMQLVVMNGTKKFASSGTYTCYTSNHGRSTNDYALVSHNALDLIGHFKVGARSPNSDHTPIHVCLDLPHMPTQRIQKATSWTYRMQATKKFDYATFLDSLLSRQCMSQNISENWVTFRQAIEEAAEVTMGQSKRNHQQVKGLPHNPWFDEECKAAKRKLKCFNKSTKEWESATKEYRMLKRKKRRMHELLKEEQEVIQFKKEPKKAWRNMKGKKEDIMGNFSMDKMYVYAQTLYAPTDNQIMMNAEIQVDTKEPITFAAALRVQISVYWSVFRFCILVRDLLLVQVQDWLLVSLWLETVSQDWLLVNLCNWSLAEVQEMERYILAAREKEIESLRKAEQCRATLAKAPMTSANPLQSPELTTLKSQPIGSHIASGSKNTSNTSILDGVFLNENWEYNLQTEKLTDLYTSYTYHVGWLDVIQATSNSTSVDKQQRMICDVIHSIVQMERQNLGINMPSMGPMRFLDTTKAKQPTISQMETPSVSPMDPSYIVLPGVSMQSEPAHGSFNFPDLVQPSLGDLPTPTMNMIGSAPSTSLAGTTPLHTSIAPMPIPIGVHQPYVPVATHPYVAPMPPPNPIAYVPQSHYPSPYFSGAMPAGINTSYPTRTICEPTSTSFRPSLGAVPYEVWDPRRVQNMHNLLDREPRSKAVQVAKIAQKYNGDGDVRKHVEIFEQVCDSLGEYNDLNRCRALSLTLSGKAGDWYRILRVEEKTIYPTLRRLFLKEYIREGVLWGVASQLQKAKREDGESVRDFISRLKNLNSRCTPNERFNNNQLLDRFMRGLHHENIYNGLIIRGITTWEAVTTNAIELEDNLMIAGERVSLDTESANPQASRHEPMTIKLIVKEPKIADMTLMDLTKAIQESLKVNQVPQNTHMYP